VALFDHVLRADGVRRNESSADQFSSDNQVNNWLMPSCDPFWQL
jgi:hypothetical protein